MDTSETPYVDIWNAIKTIAAMLPGGKSVAPSMTKALIQRGFPYYFTAKSPELTIFQQATDILNLAVTFPYVKIEVTSGGIRCALTAEQRLYQLDIRNGFLFSPPGLDLGPALREVIFCVADLRRVVGATVDPLKPAGNAAKRQAVDGMIQEIGLLRLDEMGQAQREAYIIAEIPRRNPGVTVSERMVRDRISRARKGAKPKG